MKCKETMQGMADPDHTHTCSGEHDAGDHFCPSCKRWWYEAPKPTMKGRDEH